MKQKTFIIQTGVFPDFFDNFLLVFGLWAGIKRIRKASSKIIFNIILSKLFLIIDETEFASYAGCNTLYDAENTIKDAVLLLQEFSHYEMQGSSQEQFQD